MNIFLWILQIFLALHTVMGAFWKFSHSAEQTMPSLAAIDPQVWKAMAVAEIFCAVCLVLPGLKKSLHVLIPIGAAGIAAEMLVFCWLHYSTGAQDSGPMIYWIVVAVICVFIALTRSRVKS